MARIVTPEGMVHWTLDSDDARDWPSDHGQTMAVVDAVLHRSSTERLRAARTGQEMARRALLLEALGHVPEAVLWLDNDGRLIDLANRYSPHNGTAVGADAADLTVVRAESGEHFVRLGEDAGAFNSTPTGTLRTSGTAEWFADVRPHAAWDDNNGYVMRGGQRRFNVGSGTVIGRYYDGTNTLQTVIITGATLPDPSSASRYCIKVYVDLDAGTIAAYTAPGGTRTTGIGSPWTQIGSDSALAGDGDLYALSSVFVGNPTSTTGRAMDVYYARWYDGETDIEFVPEQAEDDSDWVKQKQAASGEPGVLFVGPNDAYLVGSGSGGKRAMVPGLRPAPTATTAVEVFLACVPADGTNFNRLWTTEVSGNTGGIQLYEHATANSYTLSARDAAGSQLGTVSAAGVTFGVPAVFRATIGPSTAVRLRVYQSGAVYDSGAGSFSALPVSTADFALGAIGPTGGSEGRNAFGGPGPVAVIRDGLSAALTDAEAEAIVGWMNPEVL